MKTFSLFLFFVVLNCQSLSSQCKLDSLDYYQVDQNGKAVNGSRALIKNNINGNQRIEERILRDTLTQKLKPFWLTIETLDTKGRTLSSVQQYFTNGVYENRSRKDYTYFMDGKLESKIEFGLDLSKQFVIDKKDTYQYDSLGNYKFIQHFFYNKTLKQYETYYDQVFKYFFDIKGNIIKKFDVSIWPNYFTNIRFLYTYGTNGLLQSEISQFNDSKVKFDESSFVNRDRKEYIYDQNNKIILFQHFDVPANDTTEHLFEQIDYTYDAQNKILLILNENGCRTDYKYLGSGYTERYSCGEILQTKYYSCIVTNSSNSFKHEFSLFPNPASDVLYLNLPIEDYNQAEYQIVDLFGKIYSVSNLNESGSINISNLNMGNYFLLIKQKEQTRVLRFCKTY